MRADFPLIHNLFSTVFSTVWRKCPPSRVFLPAFPFFHRRAHRSPPTEGRKSPLRARIYNIGAEKGEKGSTPSVAFRCGRGLLGARGAERWFRPAGKGLTVGRGGAERSGGARRQWAAGGARRGGASESGRAGALRLHPSRNGRRGTGRHGRCACTIRAQF